MLVYSLKVNPFLQYPEWLILRALRPGCLEGAIHTGRLSLAWCALVFEVLFETSEQKKKPLEIKIRICHGDATMYAANVQVD